jgi:hypothetical protein
MLARGMVVLSARRFGMSGRTAVAARVRRSDGRACLRDAGARDLYRAGARCIHDPEHANYEELKRKLMDNIRRERPAPRPEVRDEGPPKIAETGGWTKLYEGLGNGYMRAAAMQGMYSGVKLAIVRSIEHRGGAHLRMRNRGQPRR